jgi:predicted N-acetyltransferase YhbS
MMSIHYSVNDTVSVDEFVRVLNASGLGERRPVDDLECISGMLRNSNLVVTARLDGVLVGIARSMTDFHYACYLSDLAVDRSHQKKGIGVALQRLTQSQLGPRCRIILLAAPQAVGYYPRIGFEHNANCWIVGRNQVIG